MFPGLCSSEFGELDSHSLEEVVLDSHNVNLDVSSTACISCRDLGFVLQMLHLSLQEESQKQNTTMPGTFWSAEGLVLSGPGLDVPFWPHVAAKGKKILTGTLSLKEKHMTATALSRLRARNFS